MAIKTRSRNEIEKRRDRNSEFDEGNATIADAEQKIILGIVGGRKNHLNHK